MKIIKKIKKVHFDEKIQVFKYHHSHTNKLENRKLRRYNRAKNRKLREIERYMRKNYLLTKDEYLCLQNKSSKRIQNKSNKHIRTDQINHISYKEKWIQPNEYLEIIC